MHPILACSVGLGRVAEVGRREMQDVDLAGGEAGEGPDAAPPLGSRIRSRSAHSSRSTRSSRSARSRWWWAAAAGLAVAVVGSALGADRLERNRLAALDGIPDLLAPLDGAVTDVWHSDVSLWPGVRQSGGRLVGVENRPGGNVGVVALDPGTGATLWQAAPRPRGTSTAGTTCALPATDVVVCLVADQTRARLLVIDAATGVVRSDTPTDTGAAIAALGADLVVGHVDADGVVRVARTDALGRASRWTFDGAHPVLTDAFGRQDVSLDVVDDLVVVGAAGSSWVLSADGGLLHTWAADPDPAAVASGRVQVLHDTRVVTEPATTDDGGRGTRVVDLASGRAFTVSGSPVHPRPDDGSLAGLILVQPPGGRSLVAYDLATGRARWSAGGTAGRGVMVLDGRVVRADADELQSLDGRTGRSVWAVPVGQTAQSTLFSDGRLVLLAQPDPERGIVLVAHGLDDGRVRWEFDLADDQYLVTVDGGLYGLSNRETVALGVAGR
ncbi:PQQ-binding-like beta-propeller repeat protein [Pengzhenrongella frigida]|uniref:Pyrrolo-quinoline quinone repeat domain-containing protein n=1 Tax=Pengzhenrongella frigida TaxID=1259133 RepID=A0A4Q5N652_9MICO|nr:PQQ-binding-like beta-propeller repeat protein [Cellulomonas sp. HLT2-17]RYV51671.1 hypothetical protein EUA98_07150 [Cellulomonas sp. HLT2-17]